VVLQKTPVDDVARHDVEEGQRHKHRDARPEDAGHDDDQVETGCLFVHFQLEVGHRRVHGHLRVHGLLQDTIRRVSERVLAAEAALEEDVRAPKADSVEEDVVGEDGRDVAVPDGTEVGVKRKVFDFEEVADTRRDDCQEGDVGGGSEAEDIGVDEDGYQ